ncbi:MAG TPA: transcription termination/antitermination protein NusA, partial [Candidatus Mediterraneibacter intestinavium]|nr:transcription termination/antitermination protein NusA [Candidatus Mediterraneibacter intestinavium]
AIGKEGQNARLAARLTGYKIDIKSETQAIEAGDLPENYMEQMGLMGEEGYTGDYEDEYAEDGVYEDYSENYDGEYDEYAREEPEEIEFVETDN